MTKGDLIVKCLKLLNENDGEQIDPLVVSELSEYKERTVNIVPSINRALNRLAEMKKLPVKKFTINYLKENKNKSITVEEEITKDILSIANIFSFNEDYGLTDTNVSYFFEGDVLILPNLTYDEHYTVFYNPKPVYLTEADLDTKEIEYPNYIIDCIPYFVKADLYEEDDPNLAVLARNLFESYANQIPTRNISTMRGIKDVYNVY